MYRIVHNEWTGTYRVERHGLLGWSFVSDPATNDYLDFTDANSARRWIQSKARRNTDRTRRWKVVSDCHV